jgi:hypothetical protein
MLLVALVAINLTIVKAVMYRANPIKELLLMGVLPMANALGIGLLVRCSGTNSRRFRLGFEVFGVVALVVFIATLYWSDVITSLYFRLFIGPYGAALTMAHIVIGNSITVFAVGVSQLAFATTGGLLFRNLRGRGPWTGARASAKSNPYFTISTIRARPPGDLSRPQDEAPNGGQTYRLS